MKTTADMIVPWSEVQAGDLVLAGGSLMQAGTVAVRAQDGHPEFRIAHISGTLLGTDGTPGLRVDLSPPGEELTAVRRPVTSGPGGDGSREPHSQIAARFLACELPGGQTVREYLTKVMLTQWPWETPPALAEPSWPGVLCTGMVAGYFAAGTYGPQGLGCFDADAAGALGRAVVRALGDPLPAGHTPAEQWCVFWGGPDPDNCAGMQITDSEDDARQDAPWRAGGGTAKRAVLHGPWEVIPPGEDAAAEYLKDGQ